MMNMKMKLRKQFQQHQQEKYLDIILTKEVENLQSESYKTSLKEIKQDLNGKIAHVHVLESLNIFKMTTQSLLKYH